ncbi:hypothetical protein L3Y34_018043 [Caenorhabditis briggsae]|uniref:Uncharacterized protein n=1 Tax=Caenorhabditis briggsae TaxID=6238 RepID=A0AAE9DJ40_CAEBR|nr:hypothetical protein L3Y34_018043 [Caenorhabditis briggsae]
MEASRRGSYRCEYTRLVGFLLYTTLSSRSTSKLSSLVDHLTSYNRRKKTRCLTVGDCVTPFTASNTQVLSQT